MTKGRTIIGVVCCNLLLWVGVVILFFLSQSSQLFQFTEKETQQRGKLRNRFMTKDGQTSLSHNMDVTLVSQSSIDRFSLYVTEILHRWNSELSISIHVTDSNKQIVRSFAHSNSFPSRLHIHYVTDNSGHYPINHLRNIAIQEVTTSHFFLTDIDIWPASDLYETILSIPSSILSIQKQAIIVPAYEVLYNSPQLRIVDKTKGINRNKDAVCIDLETCWWKHLFMVPHHKQELLSCLQYGPCSIFKKEQLTHSSTDYERWEKTTNTSEVLFPLDCFKNEGYEPYLVVKKDDSLHILFFIIILVYLFILPLFDEQYVDYGMNKLIWIFRLREEDYQFKVLLHSFCIHVPHPTTTLSGDMTFMRNQGKLTEMDFKMKEYLKELKKKGKDLKTMLPLCESVKPSVLWSQLTDL